MVPEGSVYGCLALCTWAECHGRENMSFEPHLHPAVNRGMPTAGHELSCEVMLSLVANSFNHSVEGRLKLLKR